MLPFGLACYCAQITVFVILTKTMHNSFTLLFTSLNIVNSNTSFVATCRIYIPYPFQWGMPTFKAGESFAVMAASFVASVEVCSLQELL